MGWDTTLTIDGHLVGTWRKFAPSTPVLLFTKADLQTFSGDGDASPTVVFSTSVQRCVDALQSHGFSWDLLLRDYAESRDESVELAWMKGMLRGAARFRRSDSTMAACEELFTALAATSPRDDLAALAAKVQEEALALRTASVSDVSATRPETPFRDALLFPERNEPSIRRLVLPEDAKLEHLVLIRAIDYFHRNHASAPLIGWYFALLLVLRHSLPDALVEFDLSEDPALEGLTDTGEYCEAFWADAHSHLADVARFYGGIFASVAVGTGEFATAAQFGRLEQMLGAALLETEAYRKGHVLEELVAHLVELPGTNLFLLEKRLKHSDEELDLVLRNDLSDPFWAAFRSPIVLVECKNWSQRVGISELRILETKIDDRGDMCRIGVFVSLAGFTAPFLERVRSLQQKGIVVFPVDADDLSGLIRRRCTLTDWLKENGLRKLL